MNTAVAARPLTIGRTIDASLAETWTAWSEAELVARWFAPGTMSAEVLEYDLRVGGSYRIRMRDTDGSSHTVTGRFTEVVAQKKLAMTWGWENDDAPESQVHVSFEETGGRTRISIVHEGLPSDESAGKHAQGWNGCLDKLGEQISTF